MSFEVILKIPLVIFLTTVIGTTTSFPHSVTEFPSSSSSYESFRRSSGGSATIDLDSEEIGRHFSINVTDSLQAFPQPGSQEYWREVRKHGEGEQRRGGEVRLGNVTTSPSTAPNSTDNSTAANASNATLSMGNNPDNCTLEPAFLCLKDLVHFQRNKDLRLKAIQYFVMQSLYPSKLPQPVEKPIIFGQPSPLVPFSGQLQRLGASCDVPSGVDAEVWKSTEFFHVYFNLPPTLSSSTEAGNSVSAASPEEESSEGLRSFQAVFPHQATTRFTSVKLGNSALLFKRGPVRNSNVISAKLMLYKLGRGIQDKIANLESPLQAEGTNQTELEETTEEKIRVSVYWYTSPLQKHHYKKKLLDTKMISVKEARWVEFDIQRAAVAWIGGRPNYGLVIQVENEDNDWVDARKFFASPSCPTITGNGSASASNETMERPNVLDVLPPPELEICTLSVPVTASAESPTQGKTMSTKSAPTRMSHRKHRHGHGDGQSRLHRRYGIQPTERNGIPPSTTSESPVSLFPPSVTEAGRVMTQDDNVNDMEAVVEDDHPLRDILATVATRTSSELRQRRRHQRREEDDVPLNEDESYYESPDENDEDRDVVIQKIFIASPEVGRKHHHRHNQNHHRLPSSVSRPLPAALESNGDQLVTQSLDR